ncbi:LppP/LprE family lipoprotein [Mycobacterium sp. 1274756.6]|uniref:LppP/LprE family lipoprotein n=1 Tax=Mycobacterium sp. 1274756.6 TaxID=1834076 RepID=UPI0009ED4CA6|nr:LppP/LprE family lipoprotein [Mycobacterium sp. 1274756.6]
MRLLRLWAVVFFAAGVALASPVPGAKADRCGIDLAAPEIASAVSTLLPYPGTDWKWTSDPGTVLGNFDRCATLSTALVSVERATGSSPITALMFHEGAYLGTATSKAYGFTSLNTARTTDDTVVLNYKTPGACNACAPAAVHSVRYQWQGNRVVMLDPAPPG